MKKVKGMTLIEMMVVIGIIGILAALILVAVSRAMASSRDTRRINDLNAVKAALVQYSLEKRSIPGSGSTGDGTFLNIFSGVYQLEPSYLRVLPSETRTGFDPYQYYWDKSSSSGGRFLLTAQVETKNKATLLAPSGGSCASDSSLSASGMGFTGVFRDASCSKYFYQLAGP